MSAVVAKPIGPIHSYSVREDDGPAVECVCFDAEITIDGQVYLWNEYESYDPAYEEWIDMTLPEMDYDDRQDLAKALSKALDWVEAERGRW